MKFWTLTTAAFALAGIFGLSAFALFPILAHLAPELSRPLRDVSGTQIQRIAEGSIRFQESGEGKDAILFLHGFNGQLATWDGAWPFLKDCGRSIRIDIAGYGGSSWTADSYTVAEQAARIIQFLDARGITQVTLVGVSMGGSLAAWLASHYPDRVKGLVVAAPSGYPGSLSYGGRFGKLLRPGFLNRLFTQVAASSLYRRLYPESVALQALTVSASYNDAWAQSLKDIRAHAWIMWSRGDEAIPFSFADQVSRAIPASTLLPLAAGVGHDVTATRPELIGRLACLVHGGAEPARILADLQDTLQRNGDG